MARKTVVRATPSARIESRSTAYRHAWDEKRDQYEKTYVYPGGWSVSLDGCASLVGKHPDDGELPTAARWRWTVAPLDSQQLTNGQPAKEITIEKTGSRCRTGVGIPVLGRWKVTLEVTALDGETTHSRSIVRNFRDVLVMALGDSYASGEGNKDPLAGGEPDFPTYGGLKADVWTDSQCHRSGHSWPAKVAQALENASTTVTFVSFACSGAGFLDLTTFPYAGMRSEGDEPNEPQIKVARKLIGDPAFSQTRRVDVLLANVGGNDLGFGKILTDCYYADHVNRLCQRPLERPLKTIGPSFDALESALAANFRIGQSYLAEYPNRIFTNGDNVHYPCFGNMSRDDARWISNAGARLNLRLRLAARSNGWVAVPTVDAFRRRGICASISEKTQFRDISHSILDEGRSAIAHPNHRGHKAIAKVVGPVINRDPVQRAATRIAVRFLRARVVGPDGPDHTARMKVEWWRSGCGRETETIAGLQSGVWVDISANPCFRYPIVTTGNALTVKASTGRAFAGRLRAHAIHRRSAGFDAQQLPVTSGSREEQLVARAGSRSLEVVYRIEAEAPLIGP